MKGRARAVYLVGFMGSGKTEVGGSLARELGWELLDTDRAVERRAGRPVAAIFAESGEASFRALEREVLADTTRRDEVVVATGGGLYLAADNRRAIRAHGPAVWLDVPLAEAAARVGDAGSRPLWDRDDPLALRARFERRRAAYALAALRVDAAGASPDALAARILREMRPFFR